MVTEVAPSRCVPVTLITVPIGPDVREIPVTVGWAAAFAGSVPANASDAIMRSDKLPAVLTARLMVPPRVAPMHGA